MGTARVGDVDLSYRVRGEGDPLLLVPGTAQGGDTWPPGLIDLLASRFRVITFDQRATGATPNTPGPFSIEQFAADAVGLLTALGAGPAHVVGHSMGGRVAQAMALDHPASVRSLVLAATGPGAFPGQFAPGQEMPRGIPLGLAVALAERGYEEFFKDRVRVTFFPPQVLAREPDYVRWVVDAVWRNAPTVEGYLKHVVARQAFQSADRLDRIGAPTLIMIGDADDFPGFAGSHLDQSRYLADHIPGAETAVMPGCAHGFFWQDPEGSARILHEWFADK